uniref:FBD domain-containing protein n=1 Tax=Opuntia streptacantha TaxID=393608 RepID=A0A7C8ZB68_OPUST
MGQICLQMGVEELKLRLQCSKRGFPHSYDARRRIERNDDDKHVFPTYEVLSRGGKSLSLNLKHVYLRACKFTSETENYRLLLKQLVSMEPVNTIPKSVTAFKKVAELKLLFSEPTNFSIFKMTSVLEAFPLLRTFHLMLNCSKDEEKGVMESSTDSYVHEHLRRIRFCGFYNTPHQIEFCIYMLHA